MGTIHRPTALSLPLVGCGSWLLCYHAGTSKKPLPRGSVNKISNQPGSWSSFVLEKVLARKGASADDDYRAGSQDKAQGRPRVGRWTLLQQGDLLRSPRLPRR